MAQCRQKLGKPDEAAPLYERFIKEHPESTLDVEARFCLGECYTAASNWILARRTFQDLLDKHVDSPSDRIAEAAYQLGHTWQMPKPASDEDLNLGTAALEKFIERFPKHKLASQAQLEIAEGLIERGRFDDAAERLKRFLADERYQDSEQIPDARILLGQSYQSQKKFAEALAAWREYLVKHPAHKEWSAVQIKIIDTEYLAAKEKLDAKQFDAANKLFGEFLAKYPLDECNPGILLLMTRKLCAESKWDDAIAAWRKVVSKYPQSDAASLAQYSIAEAMAKKLGKFEEALEEYRKVTWGASESNAQQAIARLTVPAITVATERVFRSNETPKLKLSTRNIESVMVRIYKIDMETYFRKMHLAWGVEALDITLIDPDRTFEFKVPKYAKYQEFENEVEVPLPGDARAGATAVTVSSKTLEATTLVLQSDLDVIVKSSRDEVFLFAENMRTGKPWGGAKLLISNGKQVFAEENTGKDGVFQKSYKELGDAASLRVFAVADGHIASNAVGLQGVKAAAGLADKGFIYTDRPAYRAGQPVHIRGCLRRAAGDAYTIEAGKKFTLEIFDGRNRLLRREQVALGDFGSFPRTIRSPRRVSPGKYRIALHDETGQNYVGEFLVLEYQLEPVQLTVDSPRRVYYRGEEIEGTIRAAYSYARRCRAAKSITSWPKAAITPRRPTPRAKSISNSPPAISTKRKCFRSPSNCRSASSKCRAISSWQCRDFRSASKCRGRSISPMKRSKLRSAPPTPKASRSVRSSRSRCSSGPPSRTRWANGWWPSIRWKRRPTAWGANRLNWKREAPTSLRVEGTDRFKNPISGQAIVQISDDKDTCRLRILADKQHYKAGDTAKVQLHWRECAGTLPGHLPRSESARLQTRRSQDRGK